MYSSDVYTLLTSVHL